MSIGETDGMGQENVSEVLAIATPSETRGGFIATQVMGAHAYDLTQPLEVRRLLREVRGYLQTCLGTHCGTDRPGRDYAIAALDDPRAILRAVNSHDDLLAALKQCAADFISEPCTIPEGYMIAAHEFLRRMEIARAAIAKAEGETP